jgi:hypothetical protein
MKLIYCPSCSDVITLKRIVKQCECGKSWGKYEDNLVSEIGGKAIPIGFSNSSFTKALLEGKKHHKTVKFDAYVISIKDTTIKT